MSNVSENNYLRLWLVISRVSLSCVNQVGGIYALNDTRLRSFGVIVMKKYRVGEATDQEGAGGSVQPPEARLQPRASQQTQTAPQHLRHSTSSILSKDAFLEWEVNKDTEEQEGKVVALKSCKQDE